MEAQEAVSLHYHHCAQCQGEILCWVPCPLADLEAAAPLPIAACPLCAAPTQP